MSYRPTSAAATFDRYRGPARPRRTRSRFSRNISQTNRWASALAGVGLTALALRQGGHRKYAAAGLGLLARGLSGFCPVTAAMGRNTATSDTKEALGGSRGIKIEETITIKRPIEEVYSFWRRLENLPRFMRHLRSVRELDDRRSHWEAKAPFGATASWDAVIINEIPHELIAWRSLDESDVTSAGSVRFRETRDGRGVDVAVTLQYAPPGGRLGAGVAWLLGEEPSRQIPEDLQRFKRLLENGEATMSAVRPDEGGDSGFFMR